MESKKLWYFCSVLYLISRYKVVCLVFRSLLLSIYIYVKSIYLYYKKYIVHVNVQEASTAQLNVILAQ